MTRTRFWWCAAFWLAGLTLWLLGPRDLRWLGSVIALGVAPWFAVTREQFGKKVTRGQIAFLAACLLVLVLAIVAPGLFRSKWSNNSLVTRVAVATAAVLGIGVNARRTFGRTSQRAA